MVEYAQLLSLSLDAAHINVHEWCVGQRIVALVHEFVFSHWIWHESVSLQFMASPLYSFCSATIDVDANAFGMPDFCIH